MIPASAQAHSIPVFINCRDRVSDLKVLVNWFEAAGIEQITFLDNASTYEPLLDYLRESPHTVCYLRQNLGHLALFTASLAPASPFILTDPDLIPLGPPEGIEYLWELGQKYSNYYKIGMGLSLDGATMPEPVRIHEETFWNPSLQIEPGVYAAPIDTTLAIWHPGRSGYGFFSSIRTGPPHVLKHSSYFSDYSNPDSFSEEDKYYLSHVEGNASGWAYDLQRYG